MNNHLGICINDIEKNEYSVVLQYYNMCVTIELYPLFEGNNYFKAIDGVIKKNINTAGNIFKKYLNLEKNNQISIMIKEKITTIENIENIMKIVRKIRPNGIFIEYKPEIIYRRLLETEYIKSYKIIVTRKNFTDLENILKMKMFINKLIIKIDLHYFLAHVCEKLFEIIIKSKNIQINSIYIEIYRATKNITELLKKYIKYILADDYHYDNLILKRIEIYEYYSSGLRTKQNKTATKKRSTKYKILF